MKTTHDVIERTNNLGEGIRSGVGATGMGVLATILSGLYHETHEAVLREYVANALDSHRLAGVTRPVEVTLPTDFNPTLVVTDHGVGMDADTLNHTYGEYVSSTKTADDDAIGYLGIGSKSALSITNQFTVTATKDGLRNTVLFYLDDDGALSHTPMAHDVPTTDPNGVIVVIPVSDVQQMRDCVGSALGFFPTGSITVDGEPHTCRTDTMTAVGTDSWCQDDTYRRSYKVIMGGISYALTEQQAKVAEQVTASLTNGTYYVSAPMGAVVLNPTREVLRDCPSNTAWVHQAFTDLAHIAVRNLHDLCGEHLARHDTLSAFRSVDRSQVRTSAKDWPFDADARTELVVLEADQSRTKSARLKLAGVPGHVTTDTMRVVVIHPGQYDTMRRKLIHVMRHQSWTAVHLSKQVSGSDGWLSWGEDKPVSVVSGEQLEELYAQVPRAARVRNTVASTPRKKPTFAVHMTDGAMLTLDAHGVQRIVEHYPSTVFTTAADWRNSMKRDKELLTEPVVVTPTRVVPKVLSHLDITLESIHTVICDRRAREQQEASDDEYLSMVIATRMWTKMGQYTRYQHPIMRRAAKLYERYRHIYMTVDPKRERRDKRLRVLSSISFNRGDPTTVDQLMFVIAPVAS